MRYGNPTANPGVEDALGRFCFFTRRYVEMPSNRGISGIRRRSRPGSVEILRFPTSDISDDGIRNGGILEGMEGNPVNQLDDVGRVRPSFVIRDSSVVGARPSRSAAPPAPRIRHAVASSTRRM